MLSQLFKRLSLLMIGITVAAIMVAAAVAITQGSAKSPKNGRWSKLDAEGKMAAKPASIDKRPVSATISPSHGGNQGLASEITLDEALKDSKIKVLVPAYLPPNAKLDIVRRWPEGYYMITQYYDLGEEWI